MEISFDAYIDPDYFNQIIYLTAPDFSTGYSTSNISSQTKFNSFLADISKPGFFNSQQTREMVENKILDDVISNYAVKIRQNLPMTFDQAFNWEIVIHEIKQDVEMDWDTVAAHMKTRNIQWNSITHTNIDEILQKVNSLIPVLPFFNDLHDYILWDMIYVVPAIVSFVVKQGNTDDLFGKWIRRHLAIGGRVNSQLLAQLLGQLDDSVFQVIIEELISIHVYFFL